MSSLPLKLIASAIGLAVVLAVVLAASAPADAAKARKHKKAETAHMTIHPGYRGGNFFPAGPIYNGQDYLGDDPDPFIRSQIYRDLGAHYGGNE